MVAFPRVVEANNFALSFLFGKLTFISDNQNLHIVQLLLSGAGAATKTDNIEFLFSRGNHFQGLLTSDPGIELVQMLEFNSVETFALVVDWVG